MKGWELLVIHFCPITILIILSPKRLVKKYKGV